MFSSISLTLPQLPSPLQNSFYTPGFSHSEATYSWAKACLSAFNECWIRLKHFFWDSTKTCKLLVFITSLIHEPQFEQSKLQLRLSALGVMCTNPPSMEQRTIFRATSYTVLSINPFWSPYKKYDCLTLTACKWTKIKELPLQSIQKNLHKTGKEQVTLFILEKHSENCETDSCINCMGLICWSPRC